jgi:hypothetical protein
LTGATVSGRLVDLVVDGNVLVIDDGAFVDPIGERHRRRIPAIEVAEYFFR